MTTNTARLGSFLLATALMLGACGSSSDSSEGALESTSDTAAEVEESATTTEAPAEEAAEDDAADEAAEEATDEAAAEDDAADEAAADDGADEAAGDAEAGAGINLLEGITEEEKAVLLSELGMTEEEFVQFEELINTDAGKQLMAEGIAESSELTLDQAGCVIDNGDILGLMMVGFEGDEAELESDLMVSFLETLETCDIPLSAFG